MAITQYSRTEMGNHEFKAILGCIEIPILKKELKKKKYQYYTSNDKYEMQLRGCM